MVNVALHPLALLFNIAPVGHEYCFFLCTHFHGGGDQPLLSERVCSSVIKSARSLTSRVTKRCVELSSERADVSHWVLRMRKHRAMCAQLSHGDLL